MQRATFHIEGMSCQKCVQHVTRALESVPGAKVEKVEVGSATVAWDEGQGSEAEVVQSLADAGYPAHKEGAA